MRYGLAVWKTGGLASSPVYPDSGWWFWLLTREALCNILLTTKVAKEIDVGMPVRIEDDLYQQAKAASQGECRTIAGQLEFWAKVGKAALDNPDLPIEFVSELLVAKKEDRSSLSSFTPGQFRA